MAILWGLGFWFAGLGALIVLCMVLMKAWLNGRW